MYAHNLSMHLVRKLAPPRLAAGVLVTLAMLTAACSNDSASRINAPPLLSSMDKGHTPAAPAASAVSAVSGPSLGAAAGFALLSAAPLSAGAVTCTNTPPTPIITGNVGSSGPAASVTNTACTITGAIIAPVSAQVLRDFNTAYDALAPKTGDCNLAHTLTSTIPASITLPPGTYCTGAALTATGVTLTLDPLGNANAAWIFKIGTSGTGALTGTNFTVAMAGGGQTCNVTWWVAQAASLTDSPFIGTILSGADITVKTTTATVGTFNGRALAKAGVTITGTNVTGCASSSGNGNGNGNGDGDDDGDHGKGDKDHGNKDHGDKDHGDKGHGSDNHKNDGHSDRDGGH
jgi:Ice-binding-like